MEDYKKIAIVTGGASGIGRALCNELVSQDVFVIVADINETEGKSVEVQLNGTAQNARYEYVDVTDYKSVESLIENTCEEFGRLDYLFNNAGITMYGELYDMSMDDWKEIMNVNLWGVINGTQIGYRIMKEQGFGHLVNTASAAGLGPSPLTTAYSTTKHAVVGLTNSLHFEAEKYGVKVSALCPVFVDTPIFASAKAIKLDKAAMTKQLEKQKLMSPETLAKIALNGVHKNKPIICPMPLRRTMDIFFTLVPTAHHALMRLVCREGRKARTS